MNRWLLALVCLICFAACGRSPALRAAASGDRDTLRQAIDGRQKVGDLSNSEAVSLARLVADHELRAATPEEAGDRVRDARPCAHELDDALAARMTAHDGAGAAAAMARLEGRGLGLDDVRRFASDPDPRWRAVGTRGLVRAEDRPARLRALLDPNPLVRREAARASRDAAEGSDPRDVPALAEAARVDPEPIVRSEAVRALGAIGPVAGDELAIRLRDLWSSGDDGLREDIALAWSGAGVWGHGGQEALRLVVASQHGPGVIEAAAAVLRHRDAPADLVQTAIGALIWGMGGGARGTRLQALALAPLDAPFGPDLLAAVQKAADDDDLEVRVSALARLSLLPAARASAGSGALQRLEALAQPGSPVGERARIALAGAGDRRVQLWVEQDLAGERPEVRLSAATALAELGVAARAAPLLADNDASVRVRAACTIVVSARLRR